MTLKELKISLTRFPSDFDDYVVALATKSDHSDAPEYQALAGVCVAKVGDEMIPVLSSEEAILFAARQGRLQNPDGTKIDL